nr:putative disease resistance protein RGA3 [Ipomoea batatas]
MAEALITIALTQLTLLMDQQIRKQLRLVRGVEREVQKLNSSLRSIQAVLADAEKRQVKDESVRVWLMKLRDISYDMDDFLAELSTAILKIQIEGVDENPTSSAPKNKVSSFLSCFGFNKVVQRRDIALRIKGINERLDIIAVEKERYKFDMVMDKEEYRQYHSTSYVDVSKIYGREGEKGTLISKLCSNGSEPELGLHIIAVVGMGGIGKTTLAQLAYNSHGAISGFEIRMWVCVSEPFDVVKVAKAIVEEVQGTAPNVFELETILCNLRSSISGRRFLLVLDDVWTEDFRKWEPLRDSLTTGAGGSKVLVTTRNERVARIMETTYTLRLEELPSDDCWSLFSKIAFHGRSKDKCEELEKVGRKIALECKGLPLAAKTIGGMMRMKNSVQDWQSVLESEIWKLEDAEKGLFPPLLLSYYDLPSAQRRCFSYCANFPKDYKIEADNLIKLWMSQGYLNPRSTADMEITGREYLEDLVMRSFFQEVERSKDGETILRFKMHDMVHDFAQYLTYRECLVMEVHSNLATRLDKLEGKARHLTLVRAEEVPFPASIGDTRKLHSFWVQSFYDSPPIVSEIDRVTSELFQSLTCLKSLDLSRNRLYQLPKELGKLTNLRYLNLSHNPLWELPETLCGLYSLQTLKIVSCDHLRKLPQGIGMLKNLRHLEIDRTESLKTLPKGVGNLDHLRTLSKFVMVSSSDSGDSICCLQDLKNLNQLQGYLKIEGLGFVEDAIEAEQAELKNKKQLVNLHMDFKPSVENEKTMELIEALEPPQELKYLQISFYGGTQLPSWMVYLSNLKKLHLQDCQNCVHLPPLGKLPALETLTIENMQNLKTMGLEFLGIADEVNSNGSTATGSLKGASSSTIFGFPKLKKLKIVGAGNWEDWEVISRVGEENIKIMPCLVYLKLSDCCKLKQVPLALLQKAPLRKLRIQKCPILQQQYQKVTGQLWSNISHIPKIRIS